MQSHRMTARNILGRCFVPCMSEFVGEYSHDLFFVHAIQEFVGEEDELGFAQQTGYGCVGRPASYGVDLLRPEVHSAH